MDDRSHRSTAKAEVTRQHILDTALELFHRDGFEETSMRGVASAAGVATGAAYYYFHSKEEVVLAFYTRTAEEMRTLIPDELAGSSDLRKRLRRIVALKLEQLAPNRALLIYLFRGAMHPDSPLSPFGPGTKAIRDETVNWFRLAIEGSSETIPKELKPSFPYLLWLYEMGMILFWLYDRSPDQKRTTRLLDGTLDLMIGALRLSRLPLLGPLRRSMASLVRDVGVPE